MGVLRFLFSLSVLVHHSALLFGYSIVGREPAIRGFFIISGFYMALILTEKYIHKSHSYWLFITNRLLRIYPIYWVVLTLTIAASFIYFTLGMNYGVEHYASYYQNAQSSVFLYAAPADIVRDMTILVRTDYFTLNPNFAEYLVVGQAWTLVLELIFYIIAPFIIRRGTKMLIGLIALSLIVRLLTFGWLRMHGEPLTDRFFPAEVVFFLFGVLAYRIYKFIKDKSLPRTLLLFVSVCVVSATLLYSLIPSIYQFKWLILKGWLYFALLIIGIPFLFLVTSRKSVDKAIGELSYPIYISHMLVYLIINNSHLIDSSSSWFTVTLAVCTIIFSQGLLSVIDRPINRYRQLRIKFEGVK